MLSYDHAYHAGGPADVHKHVALCLLLGHLSAKDKPYCFIDLYAGHGRYDIGSAAAAKTGEYKEGIGRLWTGPPSGPLAAYFDLVRSLNPDGVLKLYPGSPEIARGFARADDQLILNELHPTAFTMLKRWAGRDPRISLHRRDGLEAVGGLVPPTIRRGLVLVDPSYELKGDYAAVARKTVKAVTKWPEGIVMVWYPVLADGRQQALIEGLAGLPRVASEIAFPPRKLKALAKSADKSREPEKSEEREALRGSGIIVLNPPWHFEEQMAEAEAAMKAVLGKPR